MRPGLYGNIAIDPGAGPSGPIFAAMVPTCRLCLALLLLAGAPLLDAATPEGLPSGFTLKRLDVPRVEGRVRIDGTLDEPVWATARVIDDLSQYQPGNGTPPTERTEFRVAIDDEYLYVGARLHDSDPGAIKRSQLVQGQGVVNDDYVQVLLDTYNDRRTGYIFYVNPNGVQRDGLLFGGLSYNMDWDGIWEAAATVDEGGWTAEIAIPFKTLSFDRAGDAWGLNLIRSIRRKREEVAWSHHDRRITMELTGEMHGMAGLDQGAGLDIVPSVALSQRDRFVAGGASLVSKPSLDAFWRITPSLSSALTLNTDFSATDVDDRQVNLTRFSLFFPEKRDFFLEDSEVFEFGGLAQNGRPFFSRTIGLSAAGQPIDLDGGLRLSGKLGRYTLGMLAVRQEAAGALDAQDVFVGRAYMGFGEQSTVGGIVTFGDPASGRDNHVIGADLLLRDQLLLDGALLEARAWAQQSGGDAAPSGAGIGSAAGIARDGDERAWGASIAYPNDRVDALLGYTRIGDAFRPALGFVNRAGIDEAIARAKYRHRFAPGGRLRSWQGGIDWLQVTGTDGDLESRILTLTPFTLDTQPGDQLALELRRSTEVLERPFPLPGGLRVAPGRYDFDRAKVALTSAGFRRLAATLELEGGDFFDGDRRDARVGLTWKPNEHLLLGAQYQLNDVRLPGDAFTARVVGLTANVAFNVRWAWLNVAQYDNVSRRLGLNSRLRWWPTPGQVAYLVVNYDWREDAAGNFDPFLAETTLKFNYTFRF